jgi:cytoskeleton protein RodZ
VGDLLENFGESLKKSRQEKGLTPKDVAEATRIPAHIIEDLESGNESRMPAPVYVKGFIRAYARELGLDEEQLLQEYGDSRVLEGEPLELAVSIGTEKPSSHLAVLVLALVFAVLLLAGGYYFFYKSEEPTAQITPEPVVRVEPVKKEVLKQEEEAASAAIEEAPAGQESDSQPESAVSSEPAPVKEEIKKAGVEPEDPAVTGGGHTLEVLATEETWLRIYIDDEKIAQYLLRPGQTMSWQAKNQFKLRLGNAGGLKVVLDGRPLPPLGISGQVKEVILPEPDQN